MNTKVSFTYILECSDGSYYTGKTSDLSKRLLQHNGKLSGGAKYTRSRRPVELRYFEEHLTQRLASHREAFLKGLNHQEKEKLIKLNSVRKM